MPYITRDDGERFIIPSYRDTLDASKPAVLKKEILLLSTNYGSYIALQRKNITQYEAAFSIEPGYLLGESVWHYFKRPFDLIYCEAIPNTSEAILVIVKGGTVYLDGSFPIDSIPEELVVFKTEQNHFDIYIYGDVPISNRIEEGKFTFDASSVNSFNVLPSPVFQKLPTNKAFLLRQVDVVLKEKRIGTFPIQNALLLLAVIIIGYAAIHYMIAYQKPLPPPPAKAVNPYQAYFDTLNSPAPVEQVRAITQSIELLYTIPGWYPVEVSYNQNQLQASVKSMGTQTHVLFEWAAEHKARLQILPDGFHLALPTNIANRLPPTTITSTQQIIGNLIDRLSYVLPGNNPLTLGTSQQKGSFSETQLTLTFSNLTPATFTLLGEQLKDLPLVLTKASVKIDNGNLSGTLNLIALGN